MSLAIEPIDASSFKIGGLRFELTNDGSKRTTDDSVVFLKTSAMLALYDALFARVQPKKILEFGVFEGGSPLYFGISKPIDKYVGIDLRPPSEAVLGHIAHFGLQDRVKIYYGVSQGDRKAVDRIIEEEFGSSGIDMVIDDASHLLELTRSSFNIAFPKLRSDGVYVIEDWGWAHWDGDFQKLDGQWHDQPALSNLVFEITMAMASQPRIISRVEIGSGSWMFVSRGPEALPPGVFNVTDLIRNRRKSLPTI